MRTSDAPAMTAEDFERLLDAAIDGALVSDTGASEALEGALTRIATAETVAERARFVEEAREIHASELAP